MDLSQSGDFLDASEDYQLAGGPQGFRADTYFSPEYIVQRRPISEWPRWQAISKILENVEEDPDDILLGFAHQYQLEADYFWLRFPRYDLPDSPSRDYELQPEQRRDFLSAALPDYFLTDNFLRDLPINPQGIIDLLSLNPEAHETVRVYTPEQIEAFSQLFGYQQELPFPEPRRDVFQHGDLSLGNTIRSQRGFRLIDWEHFSWQRSGQDFSHLFIFVLLPTPRQEWAGLIDEFAAAIAEHLGVSEQQWRLLLYWELLIEFIFWQRGEDLADKASYSRQALGL
jgi:hypothetical protein